MNSPARRCVQAIPERSMPAARQWYPGHPYHCGAFDPGITAKNEHMPVRGHFNGPPQPNDWAAAFAATLLASAIWAVGIATAITLSGGAPQASVFGLTGDRAATTGSPAGIPVAAGSPVRRKSSTVGA